MSVKGGSIRTDVQAREALDELGLAAERKHLESLLIAAAKISELRRAGYRLRVDADPTSIMAKPVKIRSQYESLCRSCGAPIAIDGECVWLRGTPGVQCVRCGGARV